uniref:Uncharacterized protein n=1 Tax=Timema poppense TaxID=170557 RepID=A0A7R9DFC5_TIMPO|nr:unnamed protein product [Timema poppensis]
MMQKPQKFEDKINLQGTSGTSTNIEPLGLAARFCLFAYVREHSRILARVPIKTLQGKELKFDKKLKHVQETLHTLHWTRENSTACTCHETRLCVYNKFCTNENALVARVISFPDVPGLDPDRSSTRPDCALFSCYVIGSFVYCESSTLDHAATEACLMSIKQVVVNVDKSQNKFKD